MRSLVEGSTRRVWIRNEVTVNPRNFTIAYYYMTLVQSSGGHSTITVFVLFFHLGHAIRTLTVVGYQNARSLQISRLIKESPRQMKAPIHSVWSRSSRL